MFSLQTRPVCSLGWQLSLPFYTWIYFPLSILMKSLFTHILWGTSVIQIGFKIWSKPSYLKDLFHPRGANSNGFSHCGKRRTTLQPDQQSALLRAADVELSSRGILLVYEFWALANCLTFQGMWDLKTYLKRWAGSLTPCLSGLPKLFFSKHTL